MTRDAAFDLAGGGDASVMPDAALDLAGGGDASVMPDAALDPAAGGDAGVVPDAAIVDASGDPAGLEPVVDVLAEGRPEAMDGPSAADPTLIGHWRFDEASYGAAVDSSGNGLTLTPQGTPVSTTAAAPIGGTNTRAAMCNSSDGDHFAIASGLSRYPNLLRPSEWTISAWVEVRSLSRPQQSEILSGGDNYGLRVSGLAGGAVAAYAFSYDGRTWSRAISSNTFVLGDGRWHHLAAVTSSAAISVWLDGVETTAPHPGQRYGSNLDFFIGRSGDPNDWTRYLDGAVDDVRFYRRALGDDEIRALAMPGVPGSAR